MTTGVDALLHAARARLRRLTPAEAGAAAASGGVIVDIRSDGQRAADGLVPGALVVPRNVLEWRADRSSTVTSRKPASSAAPASRDAPPPTSTTGSPGPAPARRISSSDVAGVASNQLTPSGPRLA